MFNSLPSYRFSSLYIVCDIPNAVHLRPFAGYFSDYMNVNILQFQGCFPSYAQFIPLSHLNFVPQPVWNKAPEGHYRSPFPVYDFCVFSGINGLLNLSGSIRKLHCHWVVAPLYEICCYETRQYCGK